MLWHTLTFIGTVSLVGMWPKMDPNMLSKSSKASKIKPKIKTIAREEPLEWWRNTIMRPKTCKKTVKNREAEVWIVKCTVAVRFGWSTVQIQSVDRNWQIEGEPYETCDGNRRSQLGLSIKLTDRWPTLHHRITIKDYKERLHQPGAWAICNCD